MLQSCERYISVIFSKVSYRFTQNLFTCKSYCNLVFIICSLLVGIDCVTGKLKATFFLMKTRSFVLKFSPQKAENRIFRALKFQNFLGRNALRPFPPPFLEKGTNGPLLIQSVTLFKPLATLIFIETPVCCRHSKPSV